MPAPPGKGFYENISGYKNKFVDWVSVDGATKALYRHEDKKKPEESDYFPVPATAENKAKLTDLLGPTWNRHLVSLPKPSPFESTLRIYSSLLQIYSNLLSESTQIYSQIYSNPQVDHLALRLVLPDFPMCPAYVWV